MEEQGLTGSAVKVVTTIEEIIIDQIIPETDIPITKNADIDHISVTSSLFVFQNFVISYHCEVRKRIITCFVVGLIILQM
jgi:hypothetical protein